MSYYKNFKALPFKSFSAVSTHKLTRKKNDIYLRNNEFYPSEGHCKVQLSENSYLFFGGARRAEESTWSNNRIFIINFDIEDDDISIENIQEVKIFGAVFPSLQGSAAFYENNLIYVWGGLNLETFENTGELFLFKYYAKDKYSIEILQDSSDASISTRRLTGHVPSPRCGHTMTPVNSSFAVLFGGLEFVKNSISFDMFKHQTRDEKFYKFDLNTFSFDQIPGVTGTPRAYHSATLASIHGNDCIIYIGGCFKQSDFHRISLCDIFVLKVLPDNQFQTETLTFSCIPDIRLSYHDTLYISPYIFIVGGNTSDSLNGTSNIIAVNLETKSSDVIDLDSGFKCAGHSVIKVSDDCLMICGGKYKQYFVFTSKAMVPGACDLNDECNIMESIETSPISWIQCEGPCKKWLHQFCVGVLDHVIRGKYICKICKANTKTKSQSVHGKKRKT